VAEAGVLETTMQMPDRDSYGLPCEGFVRLKDFLGPGRPLPIGRSTWWQGIKEGRFPQPVKLLPRVTCWRVEDIRAVIDQ
jgi:prophage regulatory protein